MIFAFFKKNYKYIAKKYYIQYKKLIFKNLIFNIKKYYLNIIKKIYFQIY